MKNIFALIKAIPSIIGLIGDVVSLIGQVIKSWRIKSKKKKIKKAIKNEDNKETSDVARAVNDVFRDK